MIFLKQSTAKTVKIGPFVDQYDGDTAETGLTISQADIRLSKNGGAFAQTNNATGATHDENGWYGVPLDTTDTNTLGDLLVAVHKSGALHVEVRFMVLPANTFDSLVSGSDNLDVNAAQVGGQTASATGAVDFDDIASILTDTVEIGAAGAGLTAVGLATDAVDADALATNAVTEIVTAVLTTAMTESYNTDGNAPTVAQALHVIMQRLVDFSIIDTTISVKKLDGSTEAFTLTLDDATTPTSSGRAT